MFRRNQRDPTTYALVGLAGLSLCAMMMAVRFSWLGVFPLLLAATSIAGSTRDRQLPVRLGCAAAVVLLLPLYLYVGDWQNLARGLSTNYAQDYAASRYNAHAVWWLDDVDASGHLFAEYSDSGFIGYWLAPQIRTFVNGSLNVRRDAIDANLPIRQRRGARPGERFVDLLDRQGVDLFLGIRLPRPKPGTSPWFYTTAHLEGEAGWIRVFRNLDSAVYVRNLPRNQANLAHISSYYHERGIAFDPQRGFDPAVAITQSLAWSIEHGLVPHYFAELRSTTNDRSSPLRLKSLAMLAEVYAALGLYELAIDIDRELLHSRPAANASHRRVVWSLLRLGRHDEARRHANVFAAHNPADALSRQVISLARATGSARFEAEELASRIARLPVFDPTQAARLRGAIQRPEVR
ncbi:MAG: hypothetical protein GY944_14075 [bacterium]|nr:hypothetical protein [bacterium]